MCYSKEEGGKRCEYADAIANVRRKARYKHRNDYNKEREAEKAVTAWKEANKDFVREHLPEKETFQTTPNKKPIPATLSKLFTQRSREPITGLGKEEREAHTKKLYEEQEEWANSLPIEQQNALRLYAVNLYELVNTSLRRGGLAALLKENPFYRDGDMKGRIKRNVRELDEALATAPKPEEPRKLYRFFKVPAGVSPNDYIDRYIKTGEGFKERGYMSTTADPEFIMAHLHSRNNGNKNQGYVVMEIITKQGASLQPDEKSQSGHVQSLEKEVLLPRNLKLRILGSRRSQRFQFASDRKDLNNHYYHSLTDSSYDRWGKFKQGDTMNFPLIQMVDEELIAETSVK